MAKKKEAETLKRFQELYKIEQTMTKQKKQEKKSNNMRAFQVFIFNQGHLIKSSMRLRPRTKRRKKRN